MRAAAVATLLGHAACGVTPVEGAHEGEACGFRGECAAGYQCDWASGICVLACNPGACTCHEDPWGSTATFDDAQADVVCPASAHCLVQCTAPESCQSLRVACPPDHGCTVRCEATGTCNGLLLACGRDGVCELACTGDDNCVGATVQCGQDACRAWCFGAGQSVTLVAGGSCAPDDGCL